MSGDDADDGTPKDFNECVSQQQLQAVLEKAREEMTEAVDKAVTDGINRLNLGSQVERLDRRISTLANTVTTLADVVTKLTGKFTEVENRVKINEDEIDSSIGGNIPHDMVYDANGDVDEATTRARRLHRRLQTNTQGMGSQHRQHGNNNRAPEDPYAKTKFTIPSFLGQYDAEGYLDWEMTVEQKFSGHLVPKQHRVRQATSEFKDFAIIWWNSLAGVTYL
jgi:chromosome segregation ATPase